MRARVAASVALAASLAAGLTGCGFITPLATEKHYDASDGVSADLGDVKVLNVMAITRDSDDTSHANLVFSAVNSGDGLVQLTVQYRGKDHEITLEPGQTKVGYAKDADQRLQLSGFRQQAGALAPVYFRHGGNAEQLRVPVLDDSWATYSDLGPTSAPTSSATPSPSSSATPDPSATATPDPDSSAG